MSLRGNNFFHMVKAGLAVEPQSVNNTTVNGATIKEPWRVGRQITFVWVGGDFAASSSGRLKIQVQQKSDASWVALKEHDGTTDLEFLATAFDDAGAAEDAVLLGTVDLSFVDSSVYKAVRATFTSEGAQAIVGGVAYIISDVYERPSGQVDYLFAKTRPA